MTERTAGQSPKAATPAWRLTQVARWGGVPLLLLVWALTAPHLRLPWSWLSPLTFGGGIATVLLSFHLAAGGHPVQSAGCSRRGIVAALAAFAVVVLGALRWQGLMLSWLVDVSLLAATFCIGNSIGRRVQHPGHILPAGFVLSAVDAISVMHPSGPSHAVASSPSMLHVATFCFPVAGTSVFAPTVGLGDLVVLALLLGTASRFEITSWKVTLAGALGLVASGVVAAEAGIAIPALPLIMASELLVVAEFRRVREEDRRQAGVVVALAIGATAAWAWWQFGAKGTVGN